MLNVVQLNHIDTAVYQFIAENNIRKKFDLRSKVKVTASFWCHNFRGHFLSFYGSYRNGTNIFGIVRVCSAHFYNKKLSEPICGSAISGFLVMRIQVNEYKLTVWKFWKLTIPFYHKVP